MNTGNLVKKSLIGLSMLTAGLGISGCEPASDMVRKAVLIDQCMRIELTQKCLAQVPKGPTHIVGSNDWAEVIEQCDSNAMYQSYRKREFVKPECQAQ